MKANPMTSALLGVAVGDALGVPYEFRSRKAMADDPATDMTGYGTHQQPPGTWSDDSSLTLCLAASLQYGYDLEDIARRFIDWRDNNYWRARGKIFDIGMTTNRAISRLNSLLQIEDLEELKNQKYYGKENENGNGSLMRILPLLFYIKGKPIAEQWEIVWEVSALTHRHIRAAMSCLIYLKLAEKLLEGATKEDAYQAMRQQISDFWQAVKFSAEERTHFSKLIQRDIRETPIDELLSGGYVIEVLESGIWFFLQRDNYADTVLSIINLGHDTDTSAAIAGGLAGLYYGAADIPENWLVQIARMEEIIRLGDQLYRLYGD